MKPGVVFLLSCQLRHGTPWQPASANGLTIVVVGCIGKPDCAASKEADDVLEPSCAAWRASLRL